MSLMPAHGPKGSPALSFRTAGFSIPTLEGVLKVEGEPGADHLPLLAVALDRTDAWSKWVQLQQHNSSWVVEQPAQALLHVHAGTCGPPKSLWPHS